MKFQEGENVYDKKQKNVFEWKEGFELFEGDEDRYQLAEAMKTPEEHKLLAHKRTNYKYNQAKKELKSLTVKYQNLRGRTRAFRELIKEHDAGLYYRLWEESKNENSKNISIK